MPGSHSTTASCLTILPNAIISPTMAQYIVQGGTPLKGHVTISGNKNSCLKLMAASLLAKGTTTLTNVPHIVDVAIMAQILESLGCKVTGIGTSTISIDTSGLKFHRVDPELA